jgi:hypothetical protein
VGQNSTCWILYLFLESRHDGSNVGAIRSVNPAKVLNRAILALFVARISFHRFLPR